MTDPLPKTARLPKPIFVRQPPLHWKPPHKPNPWKEHMELGRLHPAWPDGRKPGPGWVDLNHGWMLVSSIRVGGPRATFKIIHSDEQSIYRYAKRDHPLERWQCRIRTLPGTWRDRDLYLRFMGTLTPEEDEADRAERKALYAKRQQIIADKKTKKQLEARLGALAEQEKRRSAAAAINQVKESARR